MHASPWQTYASEVCGTKNRAEYAPISADMVNLLTQSGNYAVDWEQVLIPVDASPDWGSRLCQSIRGCDFLGTVYLNGFEGVSGVIGHCPCVSGLFHSTFSGECFIGRNCHVDHSRLHDCVISSNAIVSYCPHVTGGSKTRYGNHQVITVGPENGGREVSIAIGGSFHGICDSLLSHSPVSTPPETEFSLTVVGVGAVLSRCDEVVDCLIGDNCMATLSTLQSCTLWFGRDAHSSVTRSHLDGCLLDAGCKAEGCHAEHSLLLDHASIGERARVSNCVLGPDSSVAGGECLHSVLGPFVGFHHQSLLIATVWPMGRGNIAYGAMVGANHTGRLNDQECFPGEGCFFGLGSSVKFPFNALESPYSIIAPKTSLLPQKISFPFSLLSDQDSQLDNAPTNLSMIRPAWVLLHNPYFIDRSSAKFAQRSKAKSHFTGFDLLRPSIVNLMMDAIHRLKIDKVKPYYTETDIRGLGKCVLLEKDRIIALQMYSEYCRRYALTGLLRYLEDHDELEVIPVSSEQNISPISMLRNDLRLYLGEKIDEFPYQCSIILQEYEEAAVSGGNIRAWPIRSMLADLLELEEKHYERVRNSRTKDERGSSIIEDYSEVHTAVDDDSVVKAAQNRLETLQKRIEQLRIPLS